MTDALLKPPARFSHAVLLALVLGLAGLLSRSIGHLPTLVVALGTLAAFLAGFWAFSRDAWLYTALGTVAVVLGAFGVLVTVTWAFLGAVGTAGSGGVLLSLTVALAVVGGVVAVVGGLLPDPITDQDGPAIVALFYAGGLAAGIAVAVVTVRLGLASLFGASASSVIAAGRELGFEAMVANPIAQLGSLALLLGACLWLAARLARLPLIRQLGRGLLLRLTDLSERVSEDRDGTAPDPTRVAAWLESNRRWARPTRLLGAGLFYLGLGAFALGLTPEGQSLAADAALIRRLGAGLGRSTGPQRGLVDLVVAMAVVRAAHAAAWRALNTDWTAYEDRLGYVNGALAVTVVAGLYGRTVVDVLRVTPALQFVPAGDAGPVLVATESGVRVAASGEFSIEPRPDVFGSWIDGFVALLGPEVFGVGLLAVVVLLSVLVIITATMFTAGARLTRPAGGIGLLFVSSAGVAVLGADELVAFTAAAGALFAWELYAYGDSFQGQLDPGATTITAELVHLVASGILIGVAVLVTLLGLRAVEWVPAPTAAWQGFSALTLSLGAVLLGLLYLGVRGDRGPPAEGSD